MAILYVHIWISSITHWKMVSNAVFVYCHFWAKSFKKIEFLGGNSCELETYAIRCKMHCNFWSLLYIQDSNRRPVFINHQNRQVSMRRPPPTRGTGGDMMAEILEELPHVRRFLERSISIDVRMSALVYACTCTCIGVCAFVGHYARVVAQTPDTCS